MIIYKRREKYCFRDEEGVLRKFKTLEAAQKAGGEEEKVAVSGVPYKVESSEITLEDNEEE